MRRTLLLIGAVAGVAWAVYAAPRLARFSAEDACLDDGGRVVAETGECEYADSRAGADSGSSVARTEQAFRGQLGREWELARLGTYELPPSAPRNPNIPPGDPQPGVRPTIRFAAHEPGVGGRSFCNGYGGPYTVRGDSLRITRIESTAVGCDGPDSLETRFFRGLRETRRFALDSAVLTLIAADGTRLVFVPADTARVPGQAGSVSPDDLAPL